MIIEIDDEFRIRRYNSMNWVLERWGWKKPKNKPQYEAWIKCGYFSSPWRALRAFPEHLALSPGVEDLRSLSRRWESLMEPEAFGNIKAQMDKAGVGGPQWNASVKAAQKAIADAQKD